MEALKWGLVHSRAKDPSIGFKLANARANPVGENPFLPIRLQEPALLGVLKSLIRRSSIERGFI
jgi:hypothetical protein